MKLYCDLLLAPISGVGFVLKAAKDTATHSAFQNGTRLTSVGFRGVS